MRKLLLLCSLFLFVTTSFAGLDSKCSWDKIKNNKNYHVMFQKIQANGTYKSIEDLCVDGNLLIAEPEETCELQGFDWVCVEKRFSTSLTYTKSVCVLMAPETGVSDCLKYEYKTFTYPLTWDVPVYEIYDVTGKVELLKFKKEYTIPQCN